ncbi:MAG: hypothetical protein ACXABY_01175 [Candidatus Thorarchaeota archaeon]|jgi:hypothetical protein
MIENNTSPFGWGVRWQIVGSLLGFGLELVLWKEIPGLLNIEFFGLSEKEIFGDTYLAITPLRIQFLMMDLEFYFTGGEK